MKPVWPSLIVAGWCIPVVVLAWFKFVYRPGDTGDYGGAIVALYAIGAAFVAGSVLLAAGMRGALQVPAKQLRERVFIGFAAIGLGIYILVLFVGAMLFAPT